MKYIITVIKSGSCVHAVSRGETRKAYKI